MLVAPVEIVLCPLALRGEAVALVLCEIAPSQRREIAWALLDGGAGSATDEALYVALLGKRIVGAAWGQSQPGKTAVLWPPRLVPGENSSTAGRLADAVLRHLDG